MKNNSVSYCINERKSCVGWIHKYFSDCLCNLNDEISFAFGFTSLICWGVAEIPQIITNFRTKSSHGVSLLFLLTWILGDAFNLLGCLLEPATLPTQYYTALLYTTSTVVLVLQSIYYDHVYKWWKCKKTDSTEAIEEAKRPLKPQKPDDSGIPIPSGRIRSSATSSPRKDFYYTSARSLAGSATPPVRSYMWTTRSGPSTIGLDRNDSSSEDDEPVQNSSTVIKPSATQPKPIPRSAGYGAFLATSASMPGGTNASVVAFMGYSGRKLLQEHGTGDNVYGQILGWMMAAIYMGGRIPQIWLNIKRGSVEGLNPLMFIFALIANVTYVGSILVRSTEWEKIKANLPWLLDAVVCVALDLFIILQYIYYRYMVKNDGSDDSKARKHLVS
jgi:uncharacterized protein with PQ loop repeat